MNPSEILMRLEVDAVLLPIRRGTKCPNQKAWQNLSFADTQEPNFQRSLRSAPAIGVSLGSASGGLCSIDFDDDDFLKRFLELNPKLVGTLRTTARRGANLWIVLKDAPPPSRKLVFEGAAVGEFRSDKNQTLIAGLHPEGFPYRKLVDAPPLRLRYSEIQWPKGTEGRGSPTPHSSQSSESSQSLHTLKPLHTLHNIGERIQAADLAERELIANPSLGRLYRTFVAKKFNPQQGTRNRDLVAMMTFLFRAVGKSQAIALASAFHQINQQIFHDPLEQHQQEAQAHHANCEREWFENLPPAMLAALNSLPTVYIEALRICYDLASLPDDSKAPGTFFLSCNDLADRLNLHPPQAQRILSALESAGWISIVEKGTRHAPGKRGRATRYQWDFTDWLVRRST